MSIKILKGMTWNHTRGVLPLQSAAQIYHEDHPDVQIIWEKRSLQAFADAPLESMAKNYDLLVIDHPHAGSAAATGEILPFDEVLDSEFMEDLRRNSVGKSFESYVFEGKLWALPIDAATPVAVYREDLMCTVGHKLPESWETVIQLANDGFVVMPGIPINSLMDFYMLALSLGAKLFENDKVVDREIGKQVLEELREISTKIPKWCKSADPIAIHQYLSESEKEYYCHAAYGYSVYSMPGYSKYLLKGAPPAPRKEKPMEPTLGGTGLAISSQSKNQKIAFDYAKKVMDKNFQKTMYVTSGGQPGNKAAWTDEFTNRITHGYFRDTLPALENSYLRPRYNGYIDFQNQAGELVFESRWNEANPDLILEKMNDLYRNTNSEGKRK